MSWLFKWKRNTKNSADNSNKVEINFEQNQILHQIHSLVIENTKTLSKIDSKVERIEKEFEDVKQDIKDMDKRIIYLEYEYDKIKEVKTKRPNRTNTYS